MLSAAEERSSWKWKEIQDTFEARAVPRRLANIRSRFFRMLIRAHRRVSDPRVCFRYLRSGF